MMPHKSIEIAASKLSQMDDMYSNRSSLGHPINWGELVEELREIRRNVEAGYEITFEGSDMVLRSWSQFYEWAHGRYHMLEDGYDKWIGDDS